MRVEFEPVDIRATSYVVRIEGGSVVVSMMEAAVTMEEGFREVKIREDSIELTLGRLRLPVWAVDTISLLAKGDLPLVWDEEVGYFFEQEMSDGSLLVFGEE